MLGHLPLEALEFVVHDYLGHDGAFITVAQTNKIALRTIWEVRWEVLALLDTLRELKHYQWRQEEEERQLERAIRNWDRYTQEPWRGYSRPRYMHNNSWEPLNDSD